MFVEVATLLSPLVLKLKQVNLWVFARIAPVRGGSSAVLRGVILLSLCLIRLTCILKVLLQNRAFRERPDPTQIF